EVAAREGLARDLDHRRVLAGRVVAGATHSLGANVWRGRPGSGHAAGRSSRRLEIVAPPHRDLAAVVYDDELVRKVEDEVALRGLALEPEPDRLELKGEVVPEGTVEAEVRLVRVAEECDQRAQQREDRRLPAPRLLGEPLARCANRAFERARACVHALDGLERAERLCDRGEQHAPAIVQRVDAEAALARG